MNSWIWLIVSALPTAVILYLVYLSDVRSLRSFYEKHGRYPCEVHEVVEPYIAAPTKLPCTCPDKQ